MFVARAAEVRQPTIERRFSSLFERIWEPRIDILGLVAHDTDSEHMPPAKALRAMDLQIDDRASVCPALTKACEHRPECAPQIVGPRELQAGVVVWPSDRHVRKL
jgi:hypothetical protein